MQLWTAATSHLSREEEEEGKEEEIGRKRMTARADRFKLETAQLPYQPNTVGQRAAKRRSKK